MRQPRGATTDEDYHDREQLIADIFHDLNQPLTALHCCIELCINDTHLASKHRRDLKIALQQIDTIFDLTARLEHVVNSGICASHESSDHRGEPAVPLAWLSRCCG